MSFFIAMNHKLISKCNCCHHSVTSYRVQYLSGFLFFFYVTRRWQSLVEKAWTRLVSMTFPIMLMILLTQRLNPHLFDGHMFPMVVQPYGNFWGETELSNRSEKRQKPMFLTQRQDTSRNQIILCICSENTINIFSDIPEINWLVRGRGGASRGRALLTICGLYRSSEIRTQSSAWLYFLGRLLSSVSFPYQTKTGYTLYTCT